MLTIITAIYSEAKPFIEFFHAKKITEETCYQEFSADDVRILVSGSGPIAACMALSRYFAKYPAASSDLLVNVGIAGCVFRAASHYNDSASTCTSSVSPIGELFMINKITEQSTKRTFYPDLLFCTDFRQAELVTCPVPVTEGSPIKNVLVSTHLSKKHTPSVGMPSLAICSHSSEDDIPSIFEASQPLLVDMEAAAIYQAALPHISPERIFVFKVVSDLISDSQHGKNHFDPYPLVSAHTDSICAFLTSLSTSLSAESITKPTYSDREAELISFINRKLTLTASMQAELDRILLYCKLSGKEVIPPLEELLTSLPEEIHGKKNSAPYLEKLRELLLNGSDSIATHLQPSEEHYLPFFSTIYIEEKLLNYDLINIISDISSGSKPLSPIFIKHYKDIFNRSHQNFERQKKSPSLVFAKKEGTLIYPGAPVCQSFGNEHFYYTSNVMNCIYHCDYCYLQGMYPSGHLVVFVNLEDYFKELDELLAKHPVYLCISYDTDLLALEAKLHFVSRWISYVAKHPDLTIEVRTKSGNPSIFSALAAQYSSDVLSRVIFSWTLSPEHCSKEYEHGAASLSLRLSAAKAAKAAGFSVRFCFDPMIFIPSWETAYRELVHTVFTAFDPNLLYDVSIGVFRIGSDYLKLMRKKRPNCAIVQYPYISENGVSHYGKLSKEMTDFLKQELLCYLPEEKLFFWDGESDHETQAK